MGGREEVKRKRGRRKEVERERREEERREGEVNWVINLNLRNGFFN